MSWDSANPYQNKVKEAIQLKSLISLLLGYGRPGAIGGIPQREKLAVPLMSQQSPICVGN